MAQTDARAGFRLPWSSERSTSEITETDQVDAAGEPTDVASETDRTAAHDAPVGGDATEEGSPTADAASQGPEASEPSPQPTSAPPSRKPSKFLADLTKAMQAAAEESRALTVAQFETEAKAYIEQIRDRSSGEAAALRQTADDDVQSVREWSKAEIARIREETESRITDRKSRLESEIEEHASRIEREISQVQGRVSAFEEEMAGFFERLLREDDPTRFATLAERLPEPPTFEEMSAGTDYLTPLPKPETGEPETADVVVDAVAATEVEVEAVADDAQTHDADPVEAKNADDAGDSTVAFEGAGAGEEFELDREAAFAAIQAAAEAAASAEVASDAADRAEALADIIEIVGSHDDENDENVDPRTAALGLTPDFDAAEAEAFASADASDEGEEIPEIGDEALAARLAGLAPSAEEQASPSESTSTQVVVTGLVSVASIASFKRHLGRLSGVRSVGVSSGPDGEFLFAVSHTPEMVLRDAIPAMPSFQARVTSTGEGTLTVSAHDPESDN
jgi:hypothetical protein